jgi:hypothetical protein
LRTAAEVELAQLMASSSFGRAAELVELQGTLAAVSELGESVTINGAVMNGIGIQPYRSGTLNLTEVEGNETMVYVMTSNFNSSNAVVGSVVVFRGESWFVKHISRLDPGLTEVQLTK